MAGPRYGGRMQRLIDELVLQEEGKEVSEIRAESTKRIGTARKRV